MRPWNPGSNGPVYTLETINSLIYAGGNFTSIGGASRTNVAQLDANGGVGAWNPAPNNIVNCWPTYEYAISSPTIQPAMATMMMSNGASENAQ